MIEIDEVVKNYRNVPVLDHITATLPRGGITAIIGANGAGKSTLLSVMGRLLTPEGGSVSVDGHNVATTPGASLATMLSILRQENHFTSRMTVYDLVGFGRYPYSRGRLNAVDRRHIDAALAFLQLTPLQHRYLDELSGGQRQRAYIAMVLCQDTEYVLLDEPLNNLDMKHSVGMMKQLRQAADTLGKTIVLVIHDINFASAYADHIIAMKNGAILHRGPPAQIMTPAVIAAVFDTQVHIEHIQGQYVAVYYR
ncbi:iron ABC transporter ATP-binding protein [Sodalis sp. TME1]|nr:iron ABC transporter ATP-binding protein [Sodalis sp. TME1]